jgi:hypothetical protein
MGIRFSCPNGHKLHVKSFLAGKRGVCPQCGAKFIIPDVENSPEAETGPQSSKAAAGAVEVRTAAYRSTPIDFASPSIIISVADSAVAPPEPSRAPVAASKTEAAGARENAELELGTPAPVVAIEQEPSAPPPVQFATRRERTRRHQLAIAIVLLIAVIVLAVVLIWVLHRGANSQPAQSVMHINSTKHITSTFSGGGTFYHA